MSFTVQIAALSPQPLYALEADGDTVLSLDVTTGWSGSADVAGFATTTTCKEGAAGLTFNKTGTTEASGYIVNSTLTAFDLTTAAYHGIWVKLPTLADFGNVILRLGSDGSNYIDWRWSRTGGYAFVAGWNYLRFWDGSDFTDGGKRTRTVTGTPTTTAIDYMLIGLEFSAASGTYSGFAIDWMQKHPWRYSSGAITTPEAPTKSGWLQVPQIGPSVERAQDGKLSIASASCRVIDGDGSTVITDMDRFAFLGRQWTISMGFRGEAEDPNTQTNWKPIYRGPLFKAPHIGEGWEFQISDGLEKFVRPIMQDATTAATVNITGNVVDVFLKLALSTGNATNNPTYDTLTAVRGAGIMADLFDISEIESERDNWLPTTTCDFTFNKPEPDFLAWAFAEIFLAYGIVPVVKADGRMSIKVVRPAFGSEQSATLTTSNVLTALPAYAESLEEVKNQVTIYYDYDVATDTYAAAPVRQGDTTSQARYGVRDLEIRSKGIPNSTLATKAAKRILARLGNGAPPIQLEALHTQQPRELGEVVAVTHAAVPDTSAGTYGITAKLAEVTARGFNPATGRTSLTVALTSYQQGNYRLIGPAALPNYDSQTAAQKANYGSISDGSGLLGAANDAGHVIGPG